MPGIPIAFRKENLNPSIKLPLFPRPQKPPIYLKTLIGILSFILVGGVFFWIWHLQPWAANTYQSTYLKGRLPDFVGRKNYLKLLQKELLPHQKSFSQALKIKQLWGKGGFGKTELAIEFANQHLEQFSLVWTLYCDSLEHLERGYRQLGERLGVGDAKIPFKKVKENVHLFLENHSFPLPWLLIYDNVENEFTDYPQRGGAIIVTSQKRVLNPKDIIELPPFSTEEALQLLEKITKQRQSDSMVRLVQELEGIPLLINYAAHYIKATPGCGMEEYSRLFNTYLEDKESPLRKEMDVNKRYLKSLSASWQFSLKALEKEYPLALDWLYVSAYLQPEHIPAQWMEDWLQEKPPILNHSLQHEKKEILRSLQTYGIIRYEERSESFSLHRFFQEMIRESRQSQRLDDLSGALSILAKHANDYEYAELSSWRKGQLWYMHAFHFLPWLKKNPLQSKSADLTMFFGGMGNWCIFNDLYEEALHAYQQILNLHAVKNSCSPIELGRIYKNISRALYQLNRYPEALKNAEKAENLQSKAIGQDLLEYANTLHIKGAIFVMQGRFVEAIDCNKHVLKIRLENLGISITNFEQDLSKLDPLISKIAQETEILKKKGNTFEVYKLQEKISDIGRNLNNISNCYYRLGDFNQAIPFNEKGIEVYRKNCGWLHPLTINSLRLKANLLISTGQCTEALVLLKESLKGQISLFGNAHTEHSYTWDAIGRCYLHQKQFKRASHAFKQALKMGRSLGRNREINIRAKSNLGWSYLKQGKIKQGFKSLENALVESSQIHFSTPRIVATLEDFQKALREFASIDPKAVQRAAERGYQISVETLGPDHPCTNNFLLKSLR